MRGLGPDALKKAFGERLLALLLERCPTSRDHPGEPNVHQWALEHRFGDDYVRGWYRGQRLPTVENLIRLAHALEVEIGWLLGEQRRRRREDDPAD